jgi:nicotinamidase-related amidase
MGNDDGSPYQDGPRRTASLAVKGAVSDAKRIGGLIKRVGNKLTDIHVTLDSHHTMHIAHPDMWADQNGKQPGPFTIIRADDVANGIWRARNPAHQKRMADYVSALERDGKFLHCIWPPHCRIGTWGHNVQVDLADALTEWERKYMGVVDYVTKGSSVWTEHFGAVMAQVPDPTDPSTQLNAEFIKLLQEADMIGFTGEALSHCVKTTVEQVADNIGDEHVKKIVLLTDCMSPVAAAPGTPDFPAIGQQFLRDMKARGMTLMTADQFLA